jgi:hypothetical protein
MEFRPQGLKLYLILKDTKSLRTGRRQVPARLLLKFLMLRRLNLADSPESVLA